MFDTKQSFQKIAGGVGMILSVAGFAREAETPPVRSNVIVILTDDQGWAQHGLFGDRLDIGKCAPEGFTRQYAGDPYKAMDAANRAMPFLQKLADEGALMTQAYVAAPDCSPSRAALLTGRHPQRFGVYCNDDILATGIPDTETHLATLFKKSGYRNAIIGKWHVSKPVWNFIESPSRDYHRKHVTFCKEGQHPLDCGFDYYYGFNHSGTPYYDSPNIFRNRETEPVKQTQYSTDEFTDQALQFIDENRSNPFFIYLAYNAVHTPLLDRAPEKYLKRFDTGNRDTDNYYAYLAAVDDGIGRILDRLKQYRIDENTLIVFLSDNGGVVASPFPVNGEFKGFKGQQRQGGVRVPMVMRWPDKIPAGMKYESPVSSMDVLPTALDAAKISLPENLDGKSLLPHLTGAETALPHEYLFWAGPQMLLWGSENKTFWDEADDYLCERTDHPPENPYPVAKAPAGYSVRKGCWVYSFVTPDQAVLFDVVKDPNGQENLIHTHPEVAVELEKASREWLKTLKEPARWNRDLWLKLYPAAD